MRYIFLVLVFFNAIKIKAQINQIDHIYAVAPIPDKSFFFFTKELGLPVVWDSKVNGQYASFSVWLGNVYLEFVSEDSTKNAQFEGIGLEPLQSIKDILPVLDENKVSHRNPEEGIGWTAIDLLNIFPPEIDFYIIDYNNKKRTDLNRSVANDSLENIKGGPLGVMFLKEIVIASNNFSTCKAALNRIPGIKTSGDDLFSFNKGPSIKLVNYTNDATQSSDTGIIKIVIRVRSVDTAMHYLGSKKILGKSSKDSVYIDPASVNGLLVELVDK